MNNLYKLLIRSIFPVSDTAIVIQQSSHLFRY
nr:MAG TPA: hypothetical protein [Caudoviricetes sp.]